MILIFGNFLGLQGFFSSPYEALRPPSHVRNRAVLRPLLIILQPGVHPSLPCQAGLSVCADGCRGAWESRNLLPLADCASYNWGGQKEIIP